MLPPLHRLWPSFDTVLPAAHVTSQATPTGHVAGVDLSTIADQSGFLVLDLSGGILEVRRAARAVHTIAVREML